VSYVMNGHDVARLKRGVEILCRIYFAAGARAVFPMVAGFGELASPAELDGFRRARLRASDFELTGYHPLGTARMGPDPRSSVVGPTHETHEVPGLFLCDGSAVPTSLGVNPQLTIMALATRAARYVARAVG
jgi:choline dehydrogenase-like flavoprotein